MSDADTEFRNEVESLAAEIETFCKTTLRTIHVSKEPQLRTDIIYTCDKLIPAILEMVKTIAMKNTELSYTNKYLIELCDKYKELVEKDIVDGK